MVYELKILYTIVFLEKSPFPAPLPPSSLILGMDCSSVEASITDLVSSGEAIWVGTQGGHVITFDPVSADVLLIHSRHCHTSALVSMGTEQMVIFGKERVEGMEGMEGEDEEKTVFTVWDSYVKHRVM